MYILHHSNVSFPFITPARKGRPLEVGLVSFCHACFLSALQEGLRLDVRLVSLLHQIPPRTAAGTYRASTLPRVVGYKATTSLQCMRRADNPLFHHI